MKECTVFRTVDIVAKKWSLLIILSIIKGKGSKRYHEIKKDLDRITPKVLSTRLKELESEGILIRKVNELKVTYSLTESGKDLIKVIENIKEWGLKWKVQNNQCKEKSCEFCEDNQEGEAK